MSENDLIEWAEEVLALRDNRDDARRRLTECDQDLRKAQATAARYEEQLAEVHRLAIEWLNGRGPLAPIKQSSVLQEIASVSDPLHLGVDADEFRPLDPITADAIARAFGVEPELIRDPTFIPHWAGQPHHDATRMYEWGSCADCGGLIRAYKGRTPHQCDRQTISNRPPTDPQIVEAHRILDEIHDVTIFADTAGWQAFVNGFRRCLMIFDHSLVSPSSEPKETGPPMQDHVFVGDGDTCASIDYDYDPSGPITCGYRRADHPASPVDAATESYECNRLNCTECRGKL